MNNLLQWRWEYLLFVLPILMVVGGLWQRNNEKKVWNKGCCKECNTHWRQRDMDSQGGRLYVCMCPEHHSCWISYAVDKDYKEVGDA